VTEQLTLALQPRRVPARQLPAIERLRAVLTRQGMAPACPSNCSACNHALSGAQVLEYAKRYAWLRERDLNTLHEGGVFAGRTPHNVVLNGADLDEAIDAGMLPAA
jgi:hypothetical protein